MAIFLNLKFMPFCIEYYALEIDSKIMSLTFFWPQKSPKILRHKKQLTIN